MHDIRLLSYCQTIVRILLAISSSSKELADTMKKAERRVEQTKLTATKYTLCERYYALQDEVRSVEKLPNKRVLR